MSLAGERAWLQRNGFSADSERAGAAVAAVMVQLHLVLQSGGAPRRERRSEGVTRPGIERLGAARTGGGTGAGP